MGRGVTRKLVRVLVGGVAVALLVHFGRGDSWFDTLVVLVMWLVIMGFWLFGAEYVSKHGPR